MRQKGRHEHQEPEHEERRDETKGITTRSPATRQTTHMQMDFLYESNWNPSPKSNLLHLVPPKFKVHHSHSGHAGQSDGLVCLTPRQARQSGSRGGASGGEVGQSAQLEEGGGQADGNSGSVRFKWGGAGASEASQQRGENG